MPKNIPKLRFPEFTDEWQVKKISDIFDVTRGSVLAAPKTKKRKDDSHPYPVYSSQTKDSGLMGYYSDYLYEDAITWTTDGANAGEVKYRNGRFYCTNVCGVLISKDYANKTVAELLNRVTRNYVSYVGNPKLMNGTMASIAIAVPPMGEQQKIADFLTAIDEKIEMIDKKTELLKQYKKGIMQKIFTQQIRFEDEEGEVYPDWQDKKLGNVTQPFSTRNKRRKGAPVYSVTNKNGFVLQTEHFNKTIAGEDLSSYKIIEENDFAYNPARINVGSIARFKNSIGTISSLYVCFRPTSELDASFLEYFLQLDRTRFYFSTYGEGGVRIYLWYPLFSLITISLPSTPEQQKIVNFLNSIDNKIKVEETKLASAKKFKKALLQRMFV